MLSRKYRATGRDIRASKQHKSAVHHTPHLTLVATPLPNAPVSKGACVISRRIAPKAVERNAFKRRCREALRTGEFLAAFTNSHLVLIRAKKDAHTLPFSALVQEIAALKEKAVAY